MLLALALAAIWAVVLAHVPFAITIAALVVPSAITALTNHPGTAPTNILHVLQVVMRALSWLRHANEEGWFKMPLSWSLALHNVPDAPVVQLAPRGFALVGLMWLLAVIAALLVLVVGPCVAFGAELPQTPPAHSLADVAPSDPLPPTKPQISGCFTELLCVGPTVAVSVAAINLSTKKVEGAFSPGVGVGLTYASGTWKSVGVAAYLNLDPGANQAAAAFMVSLLNSYVRAGVSKGFIGDTSTRLLFGTGIDL